MYACRAGIAAAVLVLGIAGGARAAGDGTPGAGRLALLEREARRMAPLSVETSEAPSRAPWLALAFGVGLAASFLGTFYGMRLFAFGRLVERDGWREVTYRYRSSPISLGGETLARMTGLLEELERLGAGLAPARARAAAAAAEGRRPVPVTFARRPSPSEPAVPAIAAAPPPPVRVDAPASAAALPPCAAVPAIAAAPPPPEPEDRYRRARRLLADGFDLAAVQAKTGLKRAELDLLRWSATLAASKT